MRVNFFNLRKMYNVCNCDDFNTVFNDGEDQRICNFNWAFRKLKFGRTGKIVCFIDYCKFIIITIMPAVLFFVVTVLCIIVKAESYNHKNIYTNNLPKYNVNPRFSSLEHALNGSWSLFTTSLSHLLFVLFRLLHFVPLK